MHIPVLLHETIRVLNPLPGETFVDGTFGGGGHARELVKAIAPGGTLLCIDRDDSLIRAETPSMEKLAHDKKVRIVMKQGSYADGGMFAKEADIREISGVLIDAGFSSLHVDDARRGFSFMREGPLDMRYDRSQGITADEVVNSFAMPALSDIFFKYGDERRARAIAERITKERKRKRIRTTTELADIVISVKGRRKERGLHPATKTFQAIRIYVNDELGSLERFLTGFPDWIARAGRVAVISFHALEDALVKNRFKELVRTGRAEHLFKKPLTPSRGEVAQNPRARSAKLRAIVLR